MTRSEFIRSAGAAAVLTAVGRSQGGEAPSVLAPSADYNALQAEIDEVTPQDFEAYLRDDWSWFGLTRKPALQRLDDAFDKVLREVREAVVTEKPAVWLVYNMGVVVKTREACFSIDLKHRRGPELAPLLDFALITHNHDDHYTEAFYRAMNGAGKTVVSNFKDNYGAHRVKGGVGGYTRAVKTFKLKDVDVRTSLTDHNSYLVDFTTAFEIRVGNFTIYHSGDCSNLAKLNPTRRPDLWFVHPRCGLNVGDGVRKLNPQHTVIAHLNELGHARDRWRWTWQDGLAEAEAARTAGGAALVPVWGDRVSLPR